MHPICKTSFKCHHILWICLILSCSMAFVTCGLFSTAKENLKLRVIHFNSYVELKYDDVSPDNGSHNIVGLAAFDPKVTGYYVQLHKEGEKPTGSEWWPAIVLDESGFCPNSNGERPLEFLNIQAIEYFKKHRDECNIDIKSCKKSSSFIFRGKFLLKPDLELPLEMNYMNTGISILVIPQSCLISK